MACAFADRGDIEELAASMIPTEAGRLFSIVEIQLFTKKAIRI
jgi:hypothetical protein